MHQLYHSQTFDLAVQDGSLHSKSVEKCSWLHVLPLTATDLLNSTSNVQVTILVLTNQLRALTHHLHTFVASHGMFFYSNIYVTKPLFLLLYV